MGKSGIQDEALKTSRKYQKIDKEQRKVVLKMLLTDKLSLQEVCKIQHFSIQYTPYIVANQLGLKYCTIRTIQKAYENEGRIGKKETRKKKLKVENVIKLSIINPINLQISQSAQCSELSQIYIDKYPGVADSVSLLQTQKELLNKLCKQIQDSLIQQLEKNVDKQNVFFYTTIQNTLMGSQFVFKQLMDMQPQLIPNIKQELESQSPTNPQTLNQLQQFQLYQQQIPNIYQQMRVG